MILAISKTVLSIFLVGETHFSIEIFLLILLSHGKGVPGLMGVLNWGNVPLDT